MSEEDNPEYPYSFKHKGETYRFKTKGEMQMWRYIVTHGRNVTDEFLKKKRPK